MYSNNHYNKNLKEFARELRTQSVSKAEKKIWKSLLSKEQLGVRFIRQRPIYSFIVDFFCPKLGIIVEIDGISHLNKGEYDSYREAKLTSLEYKILRFSEGEVLNQLDDVANQIRHVIYCLEEKE